MNLGAADFSGGLAGRRTGARAVVVWAGLACLLLNECISRSQSLGIAAALATIVAITV